jgi:transcriptional regulator with XRE-family HTH domain
VAGTIHSDSYKALIELLKRLRTDAGITQAELAARLRRPQTWVSKVEVGERRLDIEELRQICEALDVDLVGVIRSWLATRS